MNENQELDLISHMNQRTETWKVLKWRDSEKIQPTAYPAAEAGHQLYAFPALEVLGSVTVRHKSGKAGFETLPDTHQRVRKAVLEAHKAGKKSVTC